MGGTFCPAASGFPNQHLTTSPRRRNGTSESAGSGDVFHTPSNQLCLLTCSCRRDGSEFAYWLSRVAAALTPKPQIAKQVLSYFIRNPQAMDSLEGIARWRLLQERIHRTVQETNAALAWLVSEGYLREIANPGAEPLYHLNAARTESALAFLTAEEAEVPKKALVRHRRKASPR